MENGIQFIPDSGLCKAGIIEKIFREFARKLPKRCAAMIDSAFFKAQRCASSMRAYNKPRQPGRSQGGITAKIHLLCASGGKPMNFLIIGGNVSDIKAAPELANRNQMKVLVADKAYGSKAYRTELAEKHIGVYITPKCNEKNPAPCDRALYKKRHVIENMYCRLKDWKGIVFCGNRCAHSSHSFVALALVFIFFNANRT